MSLGINEKMLIIIFQIDCPTPIPNELIKLNITCSFTLILFYFNKKKHNCIVFFKKITKKPLRKS